MTQAVVVFNGQRYRYAQAHGRRRLHLTKIVDETDGRLLKRALCGYIPDRWRATYNVPLASACSRCMRIAGLK